MRRPDSGFSIVETVLAMFVIVAAAMYCGQLFQLSFRAQTLSRDESMALLAIEHRLQQIQRWTRARADEGGYRFNRPWPTGLADWEGRNGPSPLSTPMPASGPVPASAPFTAAADEDNPRFQVEARAWRCRIYTPARGLTRAAPMDDSMRILKVTATWGADTRAPRAREISLVALVSEPPRRLSEIRLSRSPSGVLGAGKGASITAVGVDRFGEEINDITFRWYLAPIDGNGTLGVGTPSNQATFWNYVILPNELLLNQGHATGGRCRLRVRGAADGQELWTPRDDDSSRVIDMGPRASVLVKPLPSPEATP